MDLAGARDALYAVVPGEFVSTRQDLAAQARASGDTALAAEIGKLRKPTVGAWLTNLLARTEAEQLDQLVDLGALLRDAQQALDGAQLRELGRQRVQVVAALAALARRHAAELGQPVGEGAVREVESTLTAALAEESAADLVRAGALTSALEYVGGGFGRPGDPQAVRTRAPVARPTPVKAATIGGGPGLHAVPALPGGRQDEAAQDIDRAERALAAARLQAAEAAGRQSEAQSDRRRAEEAVDAAGAEEVALAGELVELERRQESAHERSRQARTALDATARAARAADRARDQAQARLADAEAALASLRGAGPTR